MSEPDGLRLKNLLQNAPHVVLVLPVGIVGLEFSDVGDIPDMIARAIIFAVTVL